MRYRVIAALSALAAVTFLGACDARADVAVDVAADGSGTVTASVHLDAEAVSQVGDLSRSVAVDDLRAAGWVIAAPVKEKGITTLSASKKFGSPAGLDEVMSELGNRLFTGWKIRTEHGFGSTSTEVTGRIHLTGSLDQFGDDALTAALDGRPLGRTPEQLAAEAGGKPPVFPLTLTLRLPAGVTADDQHADARTEGRTRSWTFEVGDAKAVDRELAAGSDEGGALPTLFVVGGVVALVGAALLAFTPARHGRSRRRPSRPAR